MTTIYSASDNSPIDLSTLQGTHLIVTLPAAFSGTCTEQCVPGILGHLNAIKDAGVQRVIIVTADQPFAINEWVRYSKWAEADIEFASDFGGFQMREVVGKLSDESDKTDAPQCIGNLLRRGYVVVKNGEVAWKWVEPDSTQYTLEVGDLLNAIQG